MRIEFISKGYDTSDKIKDIFEKKLEKLDKFFDDTTSLKVLMKQANSIETLELTIIEGKTVIRSEVSSDNMYDNIDEALPKLEKQVIKHRKKLAESFKKLRGKDLDAYFEKAPAKEEKKKTVVRSKSFTLTPMTVEDAMDELELVGHSFYVFANKSTDTINVLYKRNDGDYGLIEAEL